MRPTLMQSVGVARTTGSLVQYVLLALALVMFPASGYLAVVHFTEGPPAQRVHVRWAPNLSTSERVRAEREHGLTDGVPLEGRSWQYFLRKRSADNIQELVRDPRVEDTFHINRETFRVQLDRPNLSPQVQAWLESDWLGDISVALALVASLLVWWSRRSLAAVLNAIQRGVHRYSHWIDRDSQAATGAVRLRWLLVLAMAWAVIVAPYIAVGPPNMEEYFTGVVSTDLAVNALTHAAWPFWSLDLGLGTPQPLRYHFIFHALAPLCAVGDCQTVLRIIVSIHLLVGAVFVTLLARRFTASWLLASVAGLTYCMSSSVANLMFTDDWPLTMLHESAIPVMVYSVLAIGDARARRDALLWSLVLGGLAGLILSITFPIPTLIMVAIIALSTPELRRRLPWFILAAVITSLIGVAHLHHIYAEYIREPANLMRADHDEFGLGQHLWSAFLRPFPLIADESHWRTVFFGAPFATAATAAAATTLDRRIRPILVGLLLGILGFVIPPSWLFNLNTAQWTYRAEVNVFGILLAVAALDRWTSRDRLSWRNIIVATQLCWVVVAFAPTWWRVAGIAIGLEQFPHSILRSPGIAEDIAAREHAVPGRVIFAPQAYDALQQPLLFNSAGLAPNELPVLRVPTVSAVINGISADALYPQSAVMESQLKAAPHTVDTRPLLNVLGIRYVLAYRGDTVAEGLSEIQRWNELRLYGNDQAWPEAFFVDALRNDRIPRLAECGHDKYLCADFSNYDLHRRDDPLQITRLYDGFRLTFPSSRSRRYILITQWYYPEWRVTQGRASLRRAAEQLIGVEIAPGERSVTVQYRPYLRASLFAMGFGTQAAVGIAIAIVATRRRKHIDHRAPIGPPDVARS